MDSLLKNSQTPQEKLLVFLVNDLEGRTVELGKLNISDIDRLEGFLRIQGDGQRIERIRLSKATTLALHEHISRRNSREPALLVKEENGGRLSEDQLKGLLNRIAERSGVEFDYGNLRFKELRKEESPRLATKVASKDLFYLYGIISHPLRRRIIELIGDEGPIGFTLIKKRLNVRVGTLYYHFDMLKGLVAQDPGKRYLLTEAGRGAYEKLHSSEYVQSGSLLAQTLPAKQGPLERALRTLALTWLGPTLQSSSLFPRVGALLILGVGALLAYQAKLETVLLFFSPATSKSVLLGLEFVAAWIIIYGLADVLATYLFRRRGEHIALLIGTAYSLLPLLIFTAWWNLVLILSIRTPLFSTFTFSRVLLILLQAWSLGLLAQAVSVSKGLRLDRAASISLAIAYTNIVIAYLRGV